VSALVWRFARRRRRRRALGNVNEARSDICLIEFDMTSSKWIGGHVV
jgi:hypothetical protein